MGLAMHALLPAALALLCYVNALGADFVFDDEAAILGRSSSPLRP